MSVTHFNSTTVFHHLENASDIELHSVALMIEGLQTSRAMARNQASWANDVAYPANKEAWMCRAIEEFKDSLVDGCHPPTPLECTLELARQLLHTTIAIGDIATHYWRRGDTVSGTPCTCDDCYYDNRDETPSESFYLGGLTDHVRCAICLEYLDGREIEKVTEYLTNMFATEFAARLTAYAATIKSDKRARLI